MIFPSIVLVLLLACVTLIIYLASIGIPRFVLDEVEKYAAEQGIDLNIESARLGYGSGLSFILREVSIDLSEETAHVPRLDIGRIRIGLRVGPLLQGKVKPYLIRIKRSEFSIPSMHGDADGLTIKDINLSCTFSSGDVMQIVSSTPIDIEGMKVSIKADIPLGSPANQNYSTTIQQQPSVIGEMAEAWIQSHQSQIDQICEFILCQDWRDGREPRINLSFNSIKSPRSSFDVYLPSLNYNNIKLSDVTLKGALSNNTLLIHQLVVHSNFDSYSHYAQKEGIRKADLQGSYQLSTREFSFTLDSNMPLMSIAFGLIKPEDFHLIDRIELNSKEYSEIRLQGDLKLDEAYGYEDASILGFLLQKNIAVDDYTIDELVLSFFFKDGNFAIDQAKIKMGDGYVSTHSHLNHGVGHIELEAKLTFEQMLMLARTGADDSLSITIPETLEFNGQVEIHAMAQMISPDFQVGRKNLNEFLPQIDSLKLDVKVPEMTYQGLHLNNSSLQASVDKLHAFDGTQAKLADKLNLKVLIEQASFQKSSADDQSEGSLQQQMSDGLEMVQLNKSQQLEHFDLTLQIEEIGFAELSDEGKRKGLMLHDIQLDAAVQGLRGKYIELEQLKLKLSDLAEIDFTKLPDAAVQGARLDLDAEEIVYKGEKIEHVELDTLFESLQKFDTELNILFDRELEERVHALIQKAADGSIHVKDVQANVPSGILNVLLPLESLSSRGISLGEQVVRFEGASKLKFIDGELQFIECDFDLNIPRLARQGVFVKPHADIINEIDFRAQGKVYQGNDGDILFEVPSFSLSKGERSLSGSMSCKEQGVLQFEVRSNLLLSTLDELIDDHLTHLIIRDFSLDDTGGIDISNLSLTVDIRDGVDVKADGHIELSRVNALLGTYDRVPDPDGTLNQEDIRSKEPCKQMQSMILHGKADVLVDVHLDPIPDSQARLLTKSRIDINNITLQYDNNRWLRYKKIQGGVAQSTLTAKSVVLDTMNNYVSIHEAKGAVYPDYAIGTFFSPLRDYLQVIELTRPIDVDSYFCCFPISLTSKVKMDGSIALVSRPNFTLKLLGVDFPLERFSGFIDFNQKGIYLDRLNAIFCEGVADARVQLTLGGDKTGYDGELILRSCNLSDIAALFDNEQSRALVNGNARFRANDMEVDSLEAYGQLEILSGDLLRMRFFAPIADMLNNLPTLIDKQEELINSGQVIPRKLTFYEKVSTKLKEGTASVVQAFGTGVSTVTNAFGQTTSNIPGANYLLKYNLKDAHCDFIINDGVLSSQDLHARGSNLAVKSRLHIDLKRMYIHANLWPEMSSIVSLMLSPITVLSDGIIDISLHGTFDDLSWKVSFSSWNDSAQDAHQEFKKSANAHFESIEQRNSKAQ